MSLEFNNFINGISFPKENIIRILKDNKINGEIISINYSNFKKVFIKIEENKKNYLLKLCLDDYSIALTDNENKGYLYLNKFNKSKFNLLNFELIIINSDYSLSKIDFIEGRKGKYLEHNKFFNYRNKLTEYYLEDYISVIKNKFNINELVQDQIINNLLKFKDLKIPLDVSHGDFIHWNTIKGLKENYVIDLEFFEKERPYFYDNFHWFLTPIINKAMGFNIKFLLINSPCSIIIKILKLSLKNEYSQNVIKDNNLFKILFILFILERYLVLDEIINLKNIDDLVDQKEKEQTLKHMNILFKLLLKFTKDAF